MNTSNLMSPLFLSFPFLYLPPLSQSLTLSLSLQTHEAQQLCRNIFAVNRRHVCCIYTRQITHIYVSNLIRHDDSWKLQLLSTHSTCHWKTANRLPVFSSPTHPHQPPLSQLTSSHLFHRNPAEKTT